MLEADQVFVAGPVARLAEAAAAGDVAAVRTMAGRVDVDARGRDGLTLLQWALLMHSAPGLQALIEAGADPSQAGVDGSTVWHQAAAADDEVYLKALLARDRRGIDAPQAGTGATPLMAALMAGRVAQRRLLVDAGANLQVPDALGNTVLHVAAKINDAQALLELLQAGADPQARNGVGADFQRYLAMTPDRVLTAEARAEREALQRWLSSRATPR